MEPKTNDCEKKGFDEIFSSKFIRSWWWIAMGIILLFVIIQCCFINWYCSSYMPPYIAYIVLIILILYPLFNSIDFLGIKLKKEIKRLDGSILHMNQKIVQNRKLTIKKIEQKIKMKKFVIRFSDFKQLENLIKTSTMQEKYIPVPPIEPQYIMENFESSLIEISKKHFIDYPVDEVEDIDIADEILEDLVDINVLDQDQSDVLMNILAICDDWIASGSISKSSKKYLEMAFPEGLRILEQIK